MRFNSLAQLKPNKIHKSQEPRATVRRIVALTAGVMRQGSRTLAGTCARRMLKNPGGGESSGCMWKRALAPRGQHNARGANRPCPFRFSIEKDRFVFLLFPKVATCSEPFLGEGSSFCFFFRLYFFQKNAHLTSFDSCFL